MNEIYWITRCDAINTFFTILMIVGTVISCVVAIIYFITNGQAIYDRSRGFKSFVIEQEGYKNTCKGILKYSIPVAIVSCLLMVLVPTTKQALLIYGVGGTIDYIKSNPVAKQIPDKCIIALDKWVNSLGEQKNDSTKK